MEDRVLKSYFVLTEIAKGGAERRVVDRNADDEAEREKAIHDPLPELGALENSSSGSGCGLCVIAQNIRLSVSVTVRVSAWLNSMPISNSS